MFQRNWVETLLFVLIDDLHSKCKSLYSFIFYIFLFYSSSAINKSLEIANLVSHCWLRSYQHTVYKNPNDLTFCQHRCTSWLDSMTIVTMKKSALVVSLNKTRVNPLHSSRSNLSPTRPAASFACTQLRPSIPSLLLKRWTEREPL